MGEVYVLIGYLCYFKTLAVPTSKENVIAFSKGEFLPQKALGFRKFTTICLSEEWI